MELLVQKHLKFIGRHLTLLPSFHQRHDPNKIAIVYYSIVGSNCLGQDIISKYGGSTTWLTTLYKSLALSDGTRISGFLGSGTMDVGLIPTIHLPSSLFAILVLLSLNAHEFFDSTLDKESLCNFIGKCQLSNGSFVSTLDVKNDGSTSATDSNDLRYCYIALSLLTIMGCKTQGDFGKYICVEKLLQFIETKRCTGGAFGDYNEPHAGYTNCALSSLKLLDKLDILSDAFKHDTIDWLVHRQVSIFDKVPLPEDSENYFAEDHGGFQGRENKYADTCYAFWCLNSLNILESMSLVDNLKLKEYLLFKTQNMLIGGFAKNNEDDPDIYHTFLGIAALSLIDGTFDGILCITEEVRKHWFG
ncbi:protein geranylgeranyltransferase type I subunit CDC43 Ecym_3350 [Eremothecium cymbalariae DBVPG|uniref:Prenyltransferase alpha-alpha toroid domain-containing protein n=1 Tax=Eremothecium cymbalariae (strain CBS 270.75 / DBVPG 7215 / KCTC 17166 / NRRL Y-17582) TaxID=931890 RepID=G8JRR9_ERECY|nr:Hypothetical protein Ecym_3350 [Eremothecium cymbalariae DBVPG\